LLVGEILDEFESSLAGFVQGVVKLGSQFLHQSRAHNEERNEHEI
jgi:hypothetical protein